MVRTIILLLCLLLFSCTNQTVNKESGKSLILDPAYKSVETIISIANCTGPTSNFTTEVHSSMDGYTYFIQKFEGSNDDFEVIMPGPKVGYMIGKEGNVTDTIAHPTTEIIKGHEFHKLHTSPLSFFDEITYSENMKFADGNCELFYGTDHFGNKAKLYYYPEDQTIRGIEFQNPMDTSETIQVLNKRWIENKDFGKLVKEVEIIQDGRDTFTFVFDTILINTPSFRKKM